MEKMRFKIEINAPLGKVFDTMLGKDTFKQWTAEFNPTSDFEGSWEKGEKIMFVGTNKEGKREGMVGKIKEFDRNKYVSIEYTGVLDGEKEVTSGPHIDEWIGTFENYSFEEKDGKTVVTVMIDMGEEMKDYFQKTYPKALNKLKELCELA